VEMLREVLLELRVQLVRSEVTELARVRLYLVEFDGAVLDDKRCREIEFTLRDVFARALYPGLAKARLREPRVSSSLAPVR
jgi:hypothetical protein